MTKITVNGKSYISISARDAAGFKRNCSECVFDKSDMDPKICSRVYSNHDLCANIIWKEDPDDTSPVVSEEKYTLSDFVEALGPEYVMGDHQKNRVAQRLKQKYDPDYQQFLKLKEKFGE